jgi:hypothetical protein
MPLRKPLLSGDKHFTHPLPQVRQTSGGQVDLRRIGSHVHKRLARAQNRDAVEKKKGLGCAKALIRKAMFVMCGYAGYLLNTLSINLIRMQRC